MEVLLSILIGLLYGGGIYLVLQRSMVKLILGFLLLGNGANLLIFVVGRIAKGKPPLIDEASKVFTEAYADPVPQALILTAIVIGFGLQAFAIILVKRAANEKGSGDIDDFRDTE